jgi:hypothetical protein
MTSAFWPGLLQLICKKWIIEIWRVQAQGIHLRRLVYLSEEEFRFLRLLRERFLRKAGRFFEKQPKARTVTKKQALGSPTRDDLLPKIDNHTSCYEPTNMINTRDCLFWSWRRVKEYCRDFLVREDNGEAREVYALMHS